MPSKERVKFHVFSRNGPQLVVVILRGGCFSNEKLYCLSDQVVNFDVGCCSVDAPRVYLISLLRSRGTLYTIVS